MAWGYWSTYNVVSREVSRKNFVSFSQARYSEEDTYETQDSVSSVPNHDKMAFERKLLLGDPDWSDKTVADRNTLPRKKQVESFKGGGRSGGSSGGVPFALDGDSRKSDDVFCPACQSSNRESRVSFGSMSSSRGSSSHQYRREEEISDIRTPRRSSTAYSASLPEEPCCSSSSSKLIESINQKMTILSSFKPLRYISSSSSNNPKSFLSQETQTLRRENHSLRSTSRSSSTNHSQRRRQQQQQRRQRSSDDLSTSMVRQSHRSLEDICKNRSSRLKSTLKETNSRESFYATNTMMTTNTRRPKSGVSDESNEAKCRMARSKTTILSSSSSLTRPRSVSVGNRIQDSDSTKTGESTSRKETYRSRSISSRSVKSSRSTSRSPSVEMDHLGCGSSKCKRSRW